MPSAITHEFVVGDTGPAIACTYTDSAGAAIDVTGWTIKLHIKRPSTHTVLTITATLSDPSNGIFQFDWSAGDMIAGQGQQAEIEFTNLTPITFTSPLFLINVRDEIA
ncbi:MAG: BppU family phage baseplate upper protein [Candidatus Hodarchaeales archaeon]|jgi:hypothetical protein